MAIQFQHLVKNIDTIDLGDICSSWQWILNDQKSVALISCIGDLFLIGNDDTINWLDTSIGQIKKVANNLGEFEQLLNEEENIDNWFLATVVKQLVNNGKTLKENEVYSFKVLPALGGDYSADNFEPTDISVHFNFTGQIHEQIKDLPEGTKINNFKFVPTKNAS